MTTSQIPPVPLTVVLAAGEGTRMRTSRPKVLHAIAGRTLLAHVLATVAQQAGEQGARLAVVVGPGQSEITAAVAATAPDAAVFVQGERLGTAHAVLAARAAIATCGGDVLVAFADTPLVRPETLVRMRAAVAHGAAVAVLGFRPVDPGGYGRLITEGDRLIAIREEKDASAEERAIGLCNAGLMALAGDAALAILERIDNHNAKGEFYLTDAVAIARAMGRDAVALETEEDEVRGVNTQAQLAEAEAVLQARLRAAAMEAGVTMAAPETVHLCADTRLAPGVTIEPYVVFGPRVTVERDAVIKSFSYLEDAKIGERSSIGPFARLRPGATLGADVKIGNFVEVKASELEDGVRANHLSYIGDTRVGAGSNVGAGTITCNYDGMAKHRTDIGANSFIGSNSSLVAPLKIGEGAYVGSGSVVTQDVPADALVLGRGRQVVKEGWAARLRRLKSGGKHKPSP